MRSRRRNTNVKYPEVCMFCGRPIRLVPWGYHFKWVPSKGDWHCPAEGKPTRAHMPEVTPAAAVSGRQRSARKARGPA